MGSDSNGSNGGNETVTIDKDIQVPANSLTKSMAEEKAARDYTEQLANSSGWERFSLGTKYGYKNWTGTKGPKSGDWDAARGRTLGYNDFLPGGIYGPTSGEKPGDEPNWDDRRSNWNQNNPNISDARVAAARSLQTDRAFDRDSIDTLSNGFSVERLSKSGKQQDMRENVHAIEALPRRIKLKQIPFVLFLLLMTGIRIWFQRHHFLGVSVRKVQTTA